MSTPTDLFVHRYRAFAGEETLPLRPLTLLYGRNNAGKSALARALAFIGASLAEDAASALVIPPELIREGNFTDLAWQGDAGDYSFDLGLRWADGEVREVRYILDGGSGRPSYVKELFILGEGGKTLWAGLAPPQRPLRPQSGYGGGEQRLVGLVPLNSEIPALNELAARMVALRGRIQWLDGVRARPQRYVERKGSGPTRLTPNGSNVAELLVERPELVESIKAFYAGLNPARELEIKEVLELGHRISLSLKSQSSWRIDLVDTGEGMTQVLPVLVAAAMAAREGSGAILAVEEPESHLHPDAQDVLARYLCSIAALSEPPTLVVETHSRVFLLGVQLAIAEGRLSPDKVGLAWVDQDSAGRSTITAVEIGPTGHPRAGWPPTALAEDVRLASALASQDLRQRG